MLHECHCSKQRFLIFLGSYQYTRIFSEDREKVATVRVCVPQGETSRASSEDPEFSENE
jgi:hypothetical protein